MSPQAAGLSGKSAYACIAGPDLNRRLFETRRTSLDLAAPLSAEDQTVQAMDDASPTKWHLGHTTWFFETFILAKELPGYRLCDERFPYCFNSYYEAAGPRHPRSFRGLLTRPSRDEVLAYRTHVDDGLEQLLARNDISADVAGLIELGIHHEQQHQELLLTDILALFAANPLRPAYRQASGVVEQPIMPDHRWINYPGGIHEIGHAGDGFYYDSEGPRHSALVHPFRIADRPVTNNEWLQFLADGGYETAAHWLSDGWATINTEGWRAPLYWEERDGRWWQMTLTGLLPVDPAAPVCHVSYFEADAFARWSGKRLPTEFEWEVAAAGVPVEGNTMGSGIFRPRPAAKTAAGIPRQMFGDTWQWTQSAYAAYPGYRPANGAVGEYNGKFMSGQYVMRGASCATADSHSRATYRTFFYPHQRWQFMGLRLAEDAS